MKRLQSAFCLALLLSLAGAALCQQAARKPRPAANPQPASASKDEEAKQQRLLAVLRVHSFAERVSADPTMIAFIVLRDVGLGVPDLTADRPGVPPALARAFINTVTKLMLRPITDAKQRQLYYVLGRFMTPKAERFAPDQLSLIAAAMSTLAQNVPPALADESAYANFKPPTAQTGDRLEAIENIADQSTREAAYLFYTYELWQKGDFALARTVASKIQDLNTSTQLQTLIDFKEAARMLDKGGSKSLAEVEKRAAKLPPGVESALLWLSIAYASIEAGDTPRADDALRAATKAARGVEDARLPLLLLNAAAQYSRIDRAQAVATLAEAVREFNAQTPEALAHVIWIHRRPSLSRLHHQNQRG